MIQKITSLQAYDWLKNGEAILIDVREPEEFKEWHIPYAISIPINYINNISSLINISPNIKIIFQCLKGMRGNNACIIFKENNKLSNNTYNIDGGIIEWKNSGLPIIKSSTYISIFRQVQIIVGLLLLCLLILGFLGISFAFIFIGIIASFLIFAGITGWCGLAIILTKLPWNK